MEDGKEKRDDDKKDDYTQTIVTRPFLYLSLALPSAPLFKDSMDRSLLPQIPLFDLLSKFDGVTEEESNEGVKRRYSITRLPPFLIIHIKRFQENNWFVEKNPTLVNFPIKNLDVKPYTSLYDDLEDDKLSAMSVDNLKKLLKKCKISSATMLEKSEMIRALIHFKNQSLASKYDLMANIYHEGKPDKGTYRVHIYQKSTDTWYEMQDLHVWSTETMPQLVALSEAYIQIYERKS